MRTSSTTSTTTRCCSSRCGRSAGRSCSASGTAVDGHTWKVRHFTDQVVLGQMMNLGHLFFTAPVQRRVRPAAARPVHDVQGVPARCLHGLTFECNAFDFDWELVGKLVRCGYDPLEIPVNYASRSFAEGKKVTMVRDPLTWFRACFKYRFSSLKSDSPGHQTAAPSLRIENAARQTNRSVLSTRHQQSARIRLSRR